MKITITLKTGKVLELTADELDELRGYSAQPVYIPQPYPVYPSYPSTPARPFWEPYITCSSNTFKWTGNVQSSFTN
jgi:hypothetical protein